MQLGVIVMPCRADVIVYRQRLPFSSCHATKCHSSLNFLNP